MRWANPQPPKRQTTQTLPFNKDDIRSYAYEIWKAREAGLPNSPEEDWKVIPKK